MIRSLDFFPKSGYNKRACDASVAQSVVHLTRNEKVACSSQVTSSSKTAGFNAKSAVLLTFWGGLKASQIGLALIWRYFFEVYKFLKNRDFEKPDFPNFFEAFYFGRKIDATGQEKLIIPQTRRILNICGCF